ILAFLAAEGWIREDVVKRTGSVLIQAAVDLMTGERVAVPEVGPIDAVENEVGQRDRIDEVFLFAAEECLAFERVDMPCGGVLAESFEHVVIGLRQKAASAAARVIHGLADFGIDGLDDRANDFARREE